MLTLKNSVNTCNCKDYWLDRVSKVSSVVGETATIYNGYSYGDPNNTMLCRTNVRWLNGYFTGLRRFIYLANYNTVIGINGGFPNSERTICDFLMYPKELGAGVYMPDIMEGYNEENDGDFSKVYDMMAELGIERSKLDYWLEHLDEYIDE